jgi:hypothetical protein
VITSQNSTEIILGSLVGSDLTSSFSYINMLSSFSITTPPSSRAFDFTFTNLYINTGIYYAIDSSSVTITPLTGSLTAASLTADSYTVNDNNNYYLSFTTANPLVSGSFISVQFPTTVALTGTCSSTTTQIGSCSIVNTTFANLTLIGNLAANSVVQIKFINAVNPNQAITIASVQIKTYYDAGLDSTVDTLTSGVTLTVTARALTNVTVSPASAVTYALGNYVFGVNLIDPIPTSGTIKVTFPSTVTLGSVTLASATFATTTCSIALTSSTVTLNACFPSGLAAGAYTFTLSNIYNPPSLQPTSSFGVLTAGTSGDVNYMNSGLTVTMTTPATSTSFALTPASTVVHAQTSYDLSFTFAVPHQIGDYLTLSIDPSMVFSSLLCTPTSGITTLSSCTNPTPTSVKIIFGSIPLSTAQISIATIRNYDISSTSIPFTVYFFNALDYAMETTSTLSKTYTAASISTFAVNNNDQIALY